MEPHKVGHLKRLWRILRRKIRRLFRKKKYIYDFHILTEYDDLRTIVQTINENGWELVCFTPYEGDLVVLFRRPTYG